MHTEIQSLLQKATSLTPTSQKVLFEAMLTPNQKEGHGH